MPLVICPDCEKIISDAAPTCLGCGRPQSIKRRDTLVADRLASYVPPIKRSRGRKAVRIFVLFHVVCLTIIFGLAYLNDRGALGTLKTFANYLPSLNIGLEAGGEQMVRQLGAGILNELGNASAACRRSAKIEAITTSRDWIFSRTASASLFISGRDESVIKIDYHIESTGEKVYVSPKDPTAGQLAVIRFGLNGCS